MKYCSTRCKPISRSGAAAKKTTVAAKVQLFLEPSPSISAHIATDMQVKSMIKLAFSNIVMLTRVTLGAYIDLITLLNCPKLDWNLIEQQRARWVMNQNIRQLDLFDAQEGVLLDTRT